MSGIIVSSYPVKLKNIITKICDVRSDKVPLLSITTSWESPKQPENDFLADFYSTKVLLSIR